MTVNLRKVKWDIKGVKDVTIIGKDANYNLKFIGFSNVNGRVVLKLEPIDDEGLYEIIDYLNNYNSDLYI